MKNRMALVIAFALAAGLVGGSAWADPPPGAPDYYSDDSPPTPHDPAYGGAGDGASDDSSSLSVPDSHDYNDNVVFGGDGSGGGSGADVAEKYMEEKGIDPATADGEVVRPYVVGTTIVDDSFGVGPYFTPLLPPLGDLGAQPLPPGFFGSGFFPFTGYTTLSGPSGGTDAENRWGLSDANRGSYTISLSPEYIPAYTLSLVRYESDAHSGMLPLPFDTQLLPPDFFGPGSSPFMGTNAIPDEYTETNDGGANGIPDEYVEANDVGTNAIPDELNIETSDGGTNTIPDEYIGTSDGGTNGIPDEYIGTSDGGTQPLPPGFFGSGFLPFTGSITFSGSQDDGYDDSPLTYNDDPISWDISFEQEGADDSGVAGDGLIGTLKPAEPVAGFNKNTIFIQVTDSQHKPATQIQPAQLDVGVNPITVEWNPPDLVVTPISDFGIVSLPAKAEVRHDARLPQVLSVEPADGAPADPLKVSSDTPYSFGPSLPPPSYGGLKVDFGGITPYFFGPSLPPPLGGVGTQLLPSGFFGSGFSPFGIDPGPTYFTPMLPPLGDADTQPVPPDFFGSGFSPFTGGIIMSGTPGDADDLGDDLEGRGGIPLIPRSELHIIQGSGETTKINWLSIFTEKLKTPVPVNVDVAVTAPAEPLGDKDMGEHLSSGQPAPSGEGYGGMGGISHSGGALFNPDDAGKDLVDFIAGDEGPGQSTDYTGARYDKNGNQIGVITYTDYDGKVSRQDFTGAKYDEKGNQKGVVTHRGDKGSVTREQYGADGRPQGSVTRDSSGNVISSTSIVYQADGGSVRTTRDSEGNVANERYDAKGRLTSSVAYDSSGKALNASGTQGSGSSISLFSGMRPVDVIDKTQDSIKGYYYDKAVTFASVSPSSGGGGDPVIGGDVPDVGGDVPDVGGDVPDVGGDVPDVGGDVPDVGGGDPVGGGLDIIGAGKL